MHILRLYITLCICCIMSIILSKTSFAVTSVLTPLQRTLVQAGDEMLENLEVSYVYGGSKIGSPKDCEICNQCLESQRPAPKERFAKCPSCGGCSLDCSHFTQFVYARAGLDYPYLTTTQMIELAPDALARKYQLLVVGNDIRQAQPGDLLVYLGHVVMLESPSQNGFGDVIHATGGKDIREPGQGIQRERQAQLAHFRGQLRRILRHRKLESDRLATYQGRTKSDVKAVPMLNRLRRVEKKNPG